MILLIPSELVNAMYDDKGRVDVKFQKKHGLLRKYRE
ncbi:uncharacterized protein METZ01_LOCUS143796 [marine metagenome]|uniref:Uncharacterized protein n=1 Tax=marine metagenome TaxID=408172 RepID=A0A381ZPY1_9ZZZZ